MDYCHKMWINMNSRPKFQPLWGWKKGGGGATYATVFWCQIFQMNSPCLTSLKKEKLQVSIKTENTDLKTFWCDTVVVRVADRLVGMQPLRQTITWRCSAGFFFLSLSLSSSCEAVICSLETLCWSRSKLFPPLWKCKHLLCISIHVGRCCAQTEGQRSGPALSALLESVFIAFWTNRLDFVACFEKWALIWT